MHEDDDDSPEDREQFNTVEEIDERDQFNTVEEMENDSDEAIDPVDEFLRSDLTGAAFVGLIDY